MTPEQYREKDFPVHHEMGDDGPVLDIGELAEAIEEKGCMLVDVVRGEDGQLRIKTICMQGEAEEDEPRDLDEALTRVKMESEEVEVDDDDEGEEDE